MQNNIRWTWADLISSYRFWGLTCFSIFVLSSKYFVTLYFPSYLRHTYNLSIQIQGFIHWAPTVLGLIVAWVASRSKCYYFLYLYSSLVIVLLLITSYCYHIENSIFIGINLFFIEVFLASISLLVAAIIAKAVDNVEFFVLTYGTVLFLNIIISMSSPISIGFIADLFSRIEQFDRFINYVDFLFCLFILQIMIGMVFLIAVNQSLFNEKPPIRNVITTLQTKKQHDSIGVFLLVIIVPFYFIYWCVRAHRDIRCYSQSSRLLTPFAAGWCAMLVPFAIPIMLLNLVDTIDEYFADKKRSYWRLIILSLFALPIAIAIVQSKLNKLPTDQM